MKKKKTTKDEPKIWLKYEAWLGNNVTQIDNAYVSGDYPRAHRGIMTLYSNMRQPDREGFIKFVLKNKEHYGASSNCSVLGLSRHDLETFLDPSTASARRRKIYSPIYERKWRNIYRAMIDYFAYRGYLFQSRVFELGNEKWD